MQECGVKIELNDENELKVSCNQLDLKPFEIITLPYPGFPTDLQAQTSALACVLKELAF